MNTAALVAAGLGVILAAVGTAWLGWWAMCTFTSEPGRHRHRQPRPALAVRTARRWTATYRTLPPPVEVVDEASVRRNAAAGRWWAQ